MKYEKIKNEGELPFGHKLISAEITVDDNEQKAIELRFENGEIIRASVENYSTFRVAITAKPKMVDRYKVSGKLFGIDLTNIFSDESDATRYATKLNNTSGVVDVKREGVKMPEDAAVLDSLPSDDFGF